MKQNLPLWLLLVLVLLQFVTSCSVKKIKNISVQHNLEKDAIPIKSQVIVHMLSKHRSKKYMLPWIGFGLTNSYLEEGKILESAAMKVFSEIFEKVVSSENTQSGSLVITISGVTADTIATGVYTANVFATVALANGEKIGFFKALGKVNASRTNDSNALENAYIKGFKELAGKMLLDDSFLTQLNKGIEKVQISKLPTVLTKEQFTAASDTNSSGSHSNRTEAVPALPKGQIPQSGTGSGFFVSKMGHVITNAHVVKNCKKLTVGDNANKQVPAELLNTDQSNDLALLKLSSLELASADSKSLIQKLSIVVVPLASKGLLRSEDVRLGEKVLVAGYPYGDYFSNTIKVTGGLVSATRGAGDDSGQFQLDAAVQAGNSGGPIYDSSGNIVGVVVSQLDKMMMAKTIGSMPENVNFGIKASTVRQFLISSGVPSKKSEQTEEKSTEQLAEIAKNQALMVMCHQ